VDNKIKNKLDLLQQELHKPNQFRGRLNELSPQLNYFLQNAESYSNAPDNFDEQSLEFLIKYLSQQHDGLKELVKILNKDLKDVKLISNHLNHLK
jgi:small nuclear ribonucleoprotein (snRNP)-like protein